MSDGFVVEEGVLDLLQRVINRFTGDSERWPAGAQGGRPIWESMRCARTVFDSLSLCPWTVFDSLYQTKHGTVYTLPSATWANIEALNELQTILQLIGTRLHLWF